MQKVLITGGAGFIGSHTVDLIVKNNIPVRVYDNFSSGKRSNLPTSNPLVEIVEADITDYESLSAAMQGVTHCLHLAAQVSVVASLEDPPGSAMNNIMGFINILTAAHTNALERLVFASSAAIYGEPESLPLEEEVSKLPLSPYGLEKQINEDYADLYHRLYQMSSLGMRYFNVYGPRQDPRSPYAGVIAKFADCINEGRNLTVFGDGEQSRDFVYVGDVARTNFAALQSNLTGACNVGTSNKTSLLDLISVLSKVAGKTSEIDFASTQTGDIRDSLADVSRMNTQLGVVAETTLEAGLSTLTD
jgi:UDP-glucose 4-epimerase